METSYNGNEPCLTSKDQTGFEPALGGKLAEVICKWCGEVTGHEASMCDSNCAMAYNEDKWAAEDAERERAYWATVVFDGPDEPDYEQCDGCGRYDEACPRTGGDSCLTHAIAVGWNEPN